MKNGNAIQRFKQKSHKKYGTKKSVNGKCLEGWYCLNDNCLECLPNSTGRETEIQPDSLGILT